MNRNIDDEHIDYESLSLGELANIIVEKYDLFPTDKRKKEYKKAIIEYNTIAYIYNRRAKDKIFKILKTK